MIGTCKCKRPCVLSEEVYWWLVKRKFELHAKSIDEVIRIEANIPPEELGLDMPPIVNSKIGEGMSCEINGNGNEKKF